MKYVQYDIKKYFELSGFLLLLCYVAGFFAWNSYLAHFAFFEYDILQTRFISAGALILVPLIGVCLIWNKFNLWFFKLNIKNQLAFYIVYVIIFTYIVFPFIPGYFGGASPSLVSIVAETNTLNALKSMSLLHSDGVESIRGCKIYENHDLLIIGFQANNIVYISQTVFLPNKIESSGVRVLHISKERILATSVLPQGQVIQNLTDEYSLFCKPLQAQYGARGLSNLFVK